MVVKSRTGKIHVKVYGDGKGIARRSDKKINLNRRSPKSETISISIIGTCLANLKMGVHFFYDRPSDAINNLNGNLSVGRCFRLVVI